MGLTGDVDNAAHVGGFIIKYIHLFTGISKPQDIKGRDVDGTYWETKDELETRIT